MTCLLQTDTKQILLNVSGTTVFPKLYTIGSVTLYFRMPYTTTLSALPNNRVSLYNSTSKLLEYFIYLKINETSHGTGAVFQVQYATSSSSTYQYLISPEIYFDFYYLCEGMQHLITYTSITILYNDNIDQFIRCLYNIDNDINNNIINSFHYL